MPRALQIFLDYFLSVLFAAVLFGLAFTPVITLGLAWGLIIFVGLVVAFGWYLTRSGDVAAGFVALLAWIVLAAGFFFGVLCRVLL